MGTDSISSHQLEDIALKLAELEKDIKHLKHLRNHHNLQVKFNIKRRNELNDQIRSLLSEAKRHRTERNKLNEEVKRLKKLRSELDRQIDEQKRILSLLEEKQRNGEDITVDFAARSRILRRVRGMANTIRKLEWRLQTEVLSSDDEKLLLRQIELISSRKSSLEQELKTNVTLEEARSALNKLLSRRARLSHKISDIAKESQIHHRLMQELFSKVKSLRTKADSYHQAFLEHKREGDKYHQDIMHKIKEKQQLKERLNELRSKLQQRRESYRQQFLEEEVRKALERYNNGEKISLEEFRLLVEKGLI